jgi:hypothetical protein
MNVLHQVGCKGLGDRVKTRELCLSFRWEAAEPEVAAAILKDGANGIAGQAVGRRAGLVPVAGKGFGLGVKAIDARPPCSHPQPALGILVEVGHSVIAQAIGVVRIGAVDSEPIAVEAVQAVFCPDLHKSLVVLHNGCNDTM